MSTPTRILIAAIALEHLWFLVLEMFLWQQPFVIRTFHTTPEIARTSAVLAANQGLYNGILAAGLVWGLRTAAPAEARARLTFFLAAVVAAGVYGGVSAAPFILALQALPALIALVLLRR